MSDAFGWRSVFIITALTALAIPLGFRILSRPEEWGNEPLDALGGILLALLVSSALFLISEGSRSGWISPQVIGGMVISFAALSALTIRQRTAQFPFIPKELIQNRRYLLFVSMTFTVMAVNLAALVGLPLLLTSVHNLTVAQIGFVLLPGAIMTASLGVAAGRLVDRIGSRLPVRVGLAMMMLAMLGLSSSAGSQIWHISFFMAILGAGFALVNTPLAAVVSLIVRSQVLALALSVNTMLLFAGGSFGTALLTAIVIARGTLASALNPLHSGQGVGFSDAFFLFAISMLLTMAMSLALPQKAQDIAEIDPVDTTNWMPNCSIPWSPSCEEHLKVAEAHAHEA